MIPSVLDLLVISLRQKNSPKPISVVISVSKKKCCYLAGLTNVLENHKIVSQPTFNGDTCLVFG
jgi:hypothetical protein